MRNNFTISPDLMPSPVWWRGITAGSKNTADTYNIRVESKYRKVQFMASITWWGGRAVAKGDVDRCVNQNKARKSL